MAGGAEEAEVRAGDGAGEEAGDPADVDGDGASDPADAAGDGAGTGATTGGGVAVGASRVRTARRREGPAAAVEEGTTCSCVAKGKQRSSK